MTHNLPTETPLLRIIAQQIVREYLDEVAAAQDQREPVPVPGAQKQPPQTDDRAT